MKMLKVETAPEVPEKVATPPNEFLDLTAAHLIFDYLAHNCYAESASSFLSQWLGPSADLSASLPVEHHHLLQSLECRKQVRRLIVDGRIAEAIRYLEEFFPQVLGDMQDVGEEGWLKFRLLCQHFFELVREGQAETALEFIDSSLTPLVNTRPKLRDYLQVTIPLVMMVDDEMTCRER